MAPCLMKDPTTCYLTSCMADDKDQPAAMRLPLCLLAFKIGSRLEQAHQHRDCVHMPVILLGAAICPCLHSPQLPYSLPTPPAPLVGIHFYEWLGTHAEPDTHLAGHLGHAIHHSLRPYMTV